MLIIPVNSEPDRRLQVQLGDNLLTLRTYWNPLAACWFMDITDSAGTVLARGLALVDGINLLEAETELTRTLGQFRVVLLDNVAVPTATNLGSGARLWWFAPGEWEGAEVADNLLTALPFDVRTMYSLDPSGIPKRLRLDGSWMLDGTFTLDGVDPR